MLSKPAPARRARRSSASDSEKSQRTAAATRTPAWRSSELASAANAGLRSMRPEEATATRPDGTSTRHISARARPRSGRSCSPCRQTTTSNEPSPNGRLDGSRVARLTSRTRSPARMPGWSGASRSRTGQDARPPPVGARPRGDVLGDVLGVPPDAVDHRRRHRVEEVQADEVQPRLAGDDPALVRRLVPADGGQVDPREVVLEPGAPDDVGHLQDAPVLEHRQPVLDAGDPGDALDPGGVDVTWPDPDERRALGDDPRPDLPAERGPVRQDAVEEDTEGQSLQDQPRREALDAERDVARVPC